MGVPPLDLSFPVGIKEYAPVWQKGSGDRGGCLSPLNLQEWLLYQSMHMLSESFNSDIRTCVFYARGAGTIQARQSRS